MGRATAHCTSHKCNVFLRMIFVSWFTVINMTLSYMRERKIMRDWSLGEQKVISGRMGCQSITSYPLPNPLRNSQFDFPFYQVYIAVASHTLG